MPDQQRRNSKKVQAVNMDSLGLEMGNKPPQALDVEEAVLGAMLIEPTAVDEALDELSPNCFYSPQHKMVFEAMTELVNEHTAVDLLTVADKLKAKGNLEVVGGPVALANLSQKVGAAAHIEYYIKILKQKAIQRDLISASYDILKQSFDDSIKVDDLVDNAQSKIYAAIQSGTRKDVQDIGSIITVAMDDIQDMQGKTGLSGVPSGFASLDSYTMGWQKSDLIIIGARPSVGKTAFALNLARNAAVDHHMPVAFFSLEMSSLQLAKRLMTSESGLPADKIKGGTKLESFEWEQLESRLKNLIKAPLYIDDTPSIPIMEFRAKAKNWVKNKGVSLIMVDYLQLMQGPAELRGMREQEVAAISRTLKGTAKELNVPIIALSQLSRNAVQRQGSNSQPQLSDLRESGSIEQDADMVLFIHRPDYLGLAPSDDASNLDIGKTFVIIAKNRNGATGEIKMVFKPDQVKFMEENDTLMSDFTGATESKMNSEVGDVSPFNQGGGEFGINNDF
jgi:replicative DNA helicase